MAGVSTVFPQTGEEKSVDIAWGPGCGPFFPTVGLH